MKLLVDMNLSPRWVNLLADAGIEAAHWSMLGARNAPEAVERRLRRSSGLRDRLWVEPRVGTS